MAKCINTFYNAVILLHLRLHSGALMSEYGRKERYSVRLSCKNVKSIRARFVVIASHGI